MLRIATILALAAITLVFVSLQKTYKHIPKKELKRRARTGDKLAKQLYGAASFGLNLEIMLWTFIGLSAGGFFVASAHWLPVWLALLGALAVLWVGFAWLPNTQVGQPSLFIARWFTPPIAWLLHNLSPGLSRFARLIRLHGRIDIHSGLYEKEDLLALIKRQQKQKDNRIEKNELEIAAGALIFGDQLVRDVMVPRRKVKAVSATETIGPILMNELHDSGFSRFPVYQDKQDNIIGTLYLHDLVVAKEGGQVRGLMSRKVYYVNEAKPLNHVLQAFFKTKHHLFVVVNNFEEVVGIITIEDILAKILGKPILGEFDQYEDLRAVATMEAQKQQQEHVSEDKVVE
jgi:CBS domain containing-hemolysin-like protein